MNKQKQKQTHRLINTENKLVAVKRDGGGGISKIGEGGQEVQTPNLKKKIAGCSLTSYASQTILLFYV